jgi:hypothetical protein
LNKNAAQLLASPDARENPFLLLPSSNLRQQKKRFGKVAGKWIANKSQTIRS